MAVQCPLCGSWYLEYEDFLYENEAYVFWEPGEVCGNQAMTGPHPDRCSPDHPCPGILQKIPENPRV